MIEILQRLHNGKMITRATDASSLAGLELVASKGKVAAASGEWRIRDGNGFKSTGPAGF